MDMLIFQLEKENAKPLYEQLYSGIKNAIIQKQIEVGTKLPSKRKLAGFLNISQTTIEIAYSQLLAEGYITSIPRVGYFVEEIDELPYVEKKQTTIEIPQKEQKQYRYDFHPGKVDEESFPFVVWRKYVKDIFDITSKELLQMGEPQGEVELRKEIANYLFQ